MSTSTSDHKMSECANSPISYTTLDSPYNNWPSQQVPQLVTMPYSCAEQNLYDHISNESSPFLRIVEQPQEHFRFRYVTEKMGPSGTHGCLLGKTYVKNKNNKNAKKTHPTVELVNFSGKALIKCCLKHHSNSKEGLFKLLEDEYDSEYSYLVPKHGIHKVAFSGIGVQIYKKEEVSNLLYRKFSEQLKDKPFDAKECIYRVSRDPTALYLSDERSAAEDYNLKFWVALQLLWASVKPSDQLQDQCKSLAKAMNLNIVRLKFSAHDVETGKEICAPVFSDPIHNKKSVATNDLKICRMSAHSGTPSGNEDIFIFVERVDKENIKICFYEEDENKKRVWSKEADFVPSDVHYQVAIAFKTPAYRDPQTATDVKVFIELVRPSDGRTSEPKEFTYKAEQVYILMKKHNNSSSYPLLDLPSCSGGSVASDIISTTVLNNNEPLQMASSEKESGSNNAVGTVLNPETPVLMLTSPEGPMWSSALQPCNQQQTNDAETNSDVFMEEIQNTQNEFTLEYFDLFDWLDTDDSDMQLEETDTDTTIPSKWVADSGSAKLQALTSSPGQSESAVGRPDTLDQVKGNLEYPAVYKPEDAAEIKKLMKELCEMLRSTKSSNNQEVRCKLERLLNIRMYNGDTFLHMTLLRNQSSFEVILKLIDSFKMSHLLNYGNNKQETILHFAVINGAPNIVSLIAKGCDPMAKNIDEENAIHYAVKYNPSCLEPLLEAAREYKVSCDLDACNSERQAALHLCALHCAAASVALLVSRGARRGVRDAEGRTPLHLCAYDARPSVARELLRAGGEDVDAADGRGNTALQIVCGRATDRGSLEMVQLLLDNGADPLLQSPHSESPWRLSRDKPDLRALLRTHVPPGTEDDVKSEPEDADEYESADDDCRDVTALKSLALKFEDLGLIDTAARIRNHINEQQQILTTL